MFRIREAKYDYFTFKLIKTFSCINEQKSGHVDTIDFSDSRAAIILQLVVLRACILI